MDLVDLRLDQAHLNSTKIANLLSTWTRHHMFPLHARPYIASLLLKYRRQFYIRNHILFLNYHNHFYIFFLSCTFASGTISYSLFFPRPSTFRLADKHVGWEKIRVTRKRVTLRGTGRLFPSSKRLGGWIRSYWRWVFFSSC